MSDLQSFFAELKQRRVVRVVILYLYPSPIHRPVQNVAEATAAVSAVPQSRSIRQRRVTRAFGGLRSVFSPGSEHGGSA